MLSKGFFKALLVAPAVLGATVVASDALAQDAASVDSLAQINEYSLEGQGSSLPQVTSVSQLSDVQPTDWAFQALQSLVERYGCIAGYPDGTYRGNRAMTRYEFAAGLNACLDRINELIAAGLADKVSREDLAVLQRLQEEFAAELATLRGRVDALEARVAELEANQFSTTTKLKGEVIFAQEIGIDEDDVFDETEVTFGYRVRLNLDTSFTGEDRLRTRLQARDLPDFDSDPIGRSFAGGGGGNFVLDDLVYTFPLFGFAEAIIGANSISCDDFVASTISPLDSSSSGSISDFGFPGQYGIACDGDAGAGAIIQVADNVSIDFGYSASDASDPDEGAGLFNGDYSAIAQLTALDLFGFADLALTYVHAYAGGGFFFDAPEAANTYGAQVNFKVNDTIEIGGGYAYVDIVNTVNGEGADSEHDTWQATLALNDLVVEGSQLGFLIGQPRFEDDFEDESSLLAELYYNVPLTDNIAITPSIIWINDPFNTDALDDTWLGNLRTTFKF